MTIVEKINSSPERVQQAEEIDLLDHGALIQDMNRSDKLSLEERAKKARKNRHKQLKLFSLYDKAEQERVTQNKSNRSVKISFPHDVALMDAAAKGAVEDMKQLLENGLDPNAKNQEGLTALHNSCIDGNPEMVKLLLEHGASVNVSDKDGWTPLHAAATCGYPDVVKSLLAAGADLLTLNGDGDMPYDIADDEETLGIIEDAMRKKDITNETIQEKRTELHTVILADVKTLIDEGENLDMPVNEEGATLLHVAIANNFNDVVELLLNNGASVDTQDIEGWKPVHAAAFFSNNDALEMLVMKKGANLRATTDSGLEPLDLVDQSIIRKNILTLMDADPQKYKVENKKPIERESPKPQVFEEIATDALLQDESASNQNIDIILPVMGESTDNDEDSEVIRRLDEHNDFMPVLKRVESISTKRNSMREAKKQAPTIKNLSFTRKDSLEAYDNSYDLLLTKKKSGPPASNKNDDNDPNLSSVQTLGNIYENEDRSKNANIADQTIEARSEIAVHEIPSQDHNRNSNELSATNEIFESGALLQISAEYGSLLKTQTRNDDAKPIIPPSAISSTAGAESVILQTSPFEDENPSNFSDNKNDHAIPSEAESTASSTQGGDFLGELKRAISPRAITPETQNTAPHESDSPTQSILEEDLQSSAFHEDDAPPASIYGSARPSTSVYESNQSRTQVYRNDALTEAHQEVDPFPETTYGSEAQTLALYDNDSQNSALYDNVTLDQHFYESVNEEVSSKTRSSQVKVEKKGRPNETSAKHEEPLYAVVEKTTRNDNKELTEKERPSLISSNGAPSTKKRISPTSGDPNSKKERNAPTDGSGSNQNKNNGLPPFGPPKDRKISNTIPASPPPVPMRKKFDTLIDNRARGTEAVKPGSLQELKLKRQKSRQTLLLEDADLSPVIPRGLESMVLRGMAEMPPSPTAPFRPPDSPTTHRKVFRAPEVIKDDSIFTHKKRCNIM
ncbi:Ankyrin repeat-containing domain [Trinorchestia longiramus]|nr:Ankyrin repeat-containing domain [Trinorchestia longiramus]